MDGVALAEGCISMVLFYKSNALPFVLVSYGQKKKQIVVVLKQRLTQKHNVNGDQLGKQRGQ